MSRRKGLLLKCLAISTSLKLPSNKILPPNTLKKKNYREFSKELCFQIAESVLSNLLLVTI